MTLKPVRLRGPKRGTCSICGSLAELTYDHVPPRGSVQVAKKDLTYLGDYLGGGHVKGLVMQSGIKFRAICSECNNKLLGSEYDPHLNRLSKEAAALLHATSSLCLPRQCTTRVRPQRVARAVVGHLLAAEIRDDMTKPLERAPFQDALRAYFLDSAAPLPSTLDIRYWVYSGNADLILHGFVVGSLHRKTSPVCDLLKYPPLAFMVIFEPDPDILIKANPLVANPTLALDEEADLTLQLDPRPRATWPEQPDNDEYVLFNSNVAYIARVRAATY